MSYVVTITRPLNEIGIDQDNHILGDTGKPIVFQSVNAVLRYFYNRNCTLRDLINFNLTIEEVVHG
jgi:hypothetical protein